MVLKGRILRFDEVRGYGFIAPDRGGEDVFLHANALLDEKEAYRSGVPVEFEALESDRGLKAASVRVLRESPLSVSTTGPVPGSAVPGSAGSAPTPSPVLTPGSAQTPGSALTPGSAPTPGSVPLPGPVSRPTTVDFSDDDGLCDVLTSAALTSEVVELCLQSVPSMTGEQIVQLRRAMTTLARRHGWVED